MTSHLDDPTAVDAAQLGDAELAGAAEQAGDAAQLGDAELARALADEAGRLLLEIRAGELADRALKDAGDAQSNELLLRRLAELRPDDVVLSEEATDPAARRTASRVWIVDPLDGTREFAERPRWDWAVHVALWQEGDLVAGAVAMPAAGITYATDRPVPVPPRVDEVAADGTARPLRLAVSRSRPPAFVAALAEQLGAELVPMGSAGVKCASVWRGEADAYVHAGGQYEWDSAAPVAVARSAGLVTCRVDGAPLAYNQTDPALPDLVVCRPEYAEPILSALQDVRAGLNEVN